MQLPPRPPATRIWKASTVAPFAGNNMLVLYSCPANSSDEYFVQVLHNEEPITMPVSALTITFTLLSFLVYSSCSHFHKHSILMSLMHKTYKIKTPFNNHISLETIPSTCISFFVFLSLPTNLFLSKKCENNSKETIMSK